jgi:alkanesulfonate monooxygenase SsuD/methylene tetrahydromethanopterin reductase-like flavin-dependent oxidoreductase (luciferase family)
MDEAIDIVRGLTSGNYFEYQGDVFDLPAVKMAPAPTERIPILVGGHSDAALRRAATRGDGWMHAGGDGDELERLLVRLGEIRRAEGTDGNPFEIHAISFDAYTPDGVRRLEEKGVTDAIVGFRVPYIKGPDSESLERKIEHLERFAESVIQKVR